MFLTSKVCFSACNDTIGMIKSMYDPLAQMLTQPYRIMDVIVIGPRKGNWSG